jgi:hypothetical protein
MRRIFGSTVRDKSIPIAGACYCQKFKKRERKKL